MNAPTDLLYTSDHEWVNVVGNVATIGITDFAQGELGDIVFIEFPELSSTVEKGQSAGSIEAVKTVADLYMPISGTVIAVNENLDNNPEAVNINVFANVPHQTLSANTAATSPMPVLIVGTINNHIKLLRTATFTSSSPRSHM